MVPESWGGEHLERHVARKGSGTVEVVVRRLPCRNGILERRRNWGVRDASELVDVGDGGTCGDHREREERWTSRGSGVPSPIVSIICREALSLTVPQAATLQPIR